MGKSAVVVQQSDFMCTLPHEGIDHPDRHQLVPADHR
jgi:hypothetical protein